MHHEGAPGQHEIDFRYSDALSTADSAVTLRVALKVIAQTKRPLLHLPAQTDPGNQWKWDARASKACPTLPTGRMRLPTRGCAWFIEDRQTIYRRATGTRARHVRSTGSSGKFI